MNKIIIMYFVVAFVVSFSIGTAFGVHIDYESSDTTCKKGTCMVELVRQEYPPFIELTLDMAQVEDNKKLILSEQNSYMVFEIDEFGNFEFVRGSMLYDGKWLNMVSNTDDNQNNFYILLVSEDKQSLWVRGVLDTGIEYYFMFTLSDVNKIKIVTYDGIEIKHYPISKLTVFLS